jgi:phage tail-like protein
MLPGIIISHSTHRFVVIAEGVYSAVFTECQLPSREVKTTPVYEGGFNGVHNLPTHIENTKLILKNGITIGFTLYEWYSQCVQEKWADAKRNAVVAMIGVTRTPLAMWGFEEAFPIKWTGPTFKTDDKAVAVETLELSFKSFEIIDASGAAGKMGI